MEQSAQPRSSARKITMFGRDDSAACESTAEAIISKVASARIPSTISPPRKLSIRPFEEVRQVRAVGMAAIVLTPRERAVEQALIHRGQRFLQVIIRAAEVFRAEQLKDGLSRNRRHEAA